MIDYLYAELNENVPNLDYEGELTSTAIVNVDADKRTIGVDVLKTPHTLYINDIAFDGSEDVNIDINVPDESDVKILRVDTGDILSDEDYELALKGKLILSHYAGGSSMQKYFMYDMRDGYIWFRAISTPGYHDISAYKGWAVNYNYLQIRQSDKTITGNISGSSYTFVREYNFDSAPTENSPKLVNSGNLYTTLINNLSQITGIYDENHVYQRGDTTFYNQEFYEFNSFSYDTTTGPFDSSKWTKCTVDSLLIKDIYLPIDVTAHPTGNTNFTSDLIKSIQSHPTKYRIRIQAGLFTYQGTMVRYEQSSQYTDYIYTCIGTNSTSKNLHISRLILTAHRVSSSQYDMSYRVIDDIPSAINDRYLHTNVNTGALEWSTIDTYSEILIPAGPTSGTLTAEQLAKLNTPRCIFIYYGSLNSIPFIKSGDDGEYWYFYREPGIDVSISSGTKTLEKSYSRIRVKKSNGAWLSQGGAYKLLERNTPAKSSTTLSLVYSGDMYNWDNKLSQIIPITYIELRNDKRLGNLIPGQLYRIIDYTCTTTQANTDSAGHQFDIIVRADGTNKLNEEARAILHCPIYTITFSSGTIKKCYVYTDTVNSKYHLVNVETLMGYDNFEFSDISLNTANHTGTCNNYSSSILSLQNVYYDYFQNNNLQAWQLWYSIENDTTRFAWADNYGIVIDNIIYMRDTSKDDTTEPYPYAWTSSENTTRYTNFIYSLPADATAYSTKYGGVQYSVSAIHHENGKGVIYRMIDEFNNDCPFDFKNAIKDSKYTFNSSSNRDASLDFLVCNNTIKSCKYSLDSYGHAPFIIPNIQINHNSNSVMDCQNIYIGENSSNIFIKEDCYNIHIEGQNWSKVTSVYRDITINSGCYHIHVGINTNHTTITSSHYLKVGDYCDYITINGATNVFIGNSCRYITTQNYLHDSIIDGGSLYLKLKLDSQAPSSSSANYIHVHSAQYGVSESNLKEVELPYSLSYTTDVYATGSTTMYV